MVECQLPKLDVAGSSPVSRSNFSTTYGLSWNLCFVCAPFTINVTLRYLKSRSSLHFRDYQE